MLGSGAAVHPSRRPLPQAPRSSPNGLVNKGRKVDAISPCFAKIVQRESQPLAGWRRVRAGHDGPRAPPIENGQRRCPRCVLRPDSFQILDSRHGHMVSVFQCSACADNAFGTMAEIRSRKVSDFGYSRHNRNGSFFTPGDLAPVQPDRISRNVGRNAFSIPRRMT